MRVMWCALFILFISRLAAQTPLPLEEALQLAQPGNLQLRKQQQRQRQAELDAAIKRGQLWPSLDFSVMSSYTDKIAALEIPFSFPGVQIPRIELGGHDRTDLSLGVRQPIFTGFRLTTQVKLAETAQAAEAVRFEVLQQQTAFQVHALFYGAQNLKKERQIQQASLQRLHTQLAQVRNLFRQAQVLAYDTLQVFNQTLQIGMQMEQTQSDLRLLDLQLARLLNLPQVRSIGDLALPNLPSALLPLDSVKQAARQQRSELRGVNLAQRAAQLQRKLARGNYFPEIGAEARYHYAKPGINQFANEWMAYATLGVNLQWNLWRGQQDRNRIQAVQVEYERLQLEEEELQRTIAYEVEKSWENMKLAAQQNRLAERLLAQQQERYRIVTTQQREGQATTNDVVIAEFDLTQAELQVQRTLIQYYLAQTELQLAAGGLGAPKE